MEELFDEGGKFFDGGAVGGGYEQVGELAFGFGGEFGGIFAGADFHEAGIGNHHPESVFGGKVFDGEDGFGDGAAKGVVVGAGGDFDDFGGAVDAAHGDGFAAVDAEGKIAEGAGGVERAGGGRGRNAGRGGRGGILGGGGEGRRGLGPHGGRRGRGAGERGGGGGDGGGRGGGALFHSYGCGSAVFLEEGGFVVEVDGNELPAIEGFVADGDFVGVAGGAVDDADGGGAAGGIEQGA